MTSPPRSTGTPPSVQLFKYPREQNLYNTSSLTGAAGVLPRSSPSADPSAASANRPARSKACRLRPIFITRSSLLVPSRWLPRANFVVGTAIRLELTTDALEDARQPGPIHWLPGQPSLESGPMRKESGARLEGRARGVCGCG